MPIKAAVMGLGNIGRYAIEALEIQPDFTCVGVIRRKESLGKDAHVYAAFRNTPALRTWKPCPASRMSCCCAPLPARSPKSRAICSAGAITPMDSFDIHDRIVETIGLLETQAVKGKAVAITAAGWDPGHGTP